MRKKKEEKRVIVYLEGIYTKEQIKNWEKDHPGEKLAFSIRHPNMPHYCMIVDLILLLIFKIAILVQLGPLL